MFLLLRKLWFRRPRPGAEKESGQRDTANGSGGPAPESQEKGLQIPDITFTPTAPYNETEMIVNQLALLAATVSHTSSTTQQEPPTPIKTEIQQPTADIVVEQADEDEEETFYHLSSLITISCLPPNHTPTRSLSTLAFKSARRKSLVFDAKRSSSILSLNLGDLPSLPFPKSKHKTARKPARYSPLPPPFVQKSPAMRPEVRF